MIVCPPIALCMALLETKDGSIRATAEGTDNVSGRLFTSQRMAEGRSKGLWGPLRANWRDSATWHHWGMEVNQSGKGTIRCPRTCHRPILKKFIGSDKPIFEIIPLISRDRAALRMVIPHLPISYGTNLWLNGPYRNGD